MGWARTLKWRRREIGCGGREEERTSLPLLWCTSDQQRPSSPHENLTSFVLRLKEEREGGEETEEEEEEEAEEEEEEEEEEEGGGGGGFFKGL